MSGSAHDDRPWRIGRHYRIHVYEVTPDGQDDRPVATFHRAEDAERAVRAVNGAAAFDDPGLAEP